VEFLERLSRSRQGDLAAQRELFERWRPLLRLQARRLLGAELSARVDPSDVVQEALRQAAQDLDQFRGTTQAEWVGWLRAVVAGQAAKARRYHSAGRRAVGREEARPDAEVQASPAGVLDRLIEAEEAARLAAAVEALPEAMQEVILRRQFDRLPLVAVAAGLGRTPQATRSLLTQALRRLARALNEEAQGETP
jgi:RNA polymerase sigma-70 factor (ECF subfamily)